MDNADLLKLWLGQTAVQAPALLICLAACLMVLARWKQIAPGSIWALLGFALSLGLVIVLPTGSVLIQRYGIEHMLPMAQVGTLFTVFAVVGSLLHAAAYACLLAAILLRRPAPTVTLPPDVKILS